MKKITLTLIAAFFAIASFAQCEDDYCIWDLYNSYGVKVYAKFCKENSANLPRVRISVTNFNTSKDKNYKISYRVKWFNKQGEWVKTTGTQTLYSDANTVKHNAGYDYYPSEQPAYSYGSYQIIDLEIKSQ